MFTPKTVKTETTTDFVPVVPEAGLQPVQVGMLVYLGKHKKQPRFAKDAQGNVELDENGNKKIIHPKEGDKGLEQKVAAYVDLLEQTHDYGNDIGVKNIREPLHKISYAISEGLNYTTVAPRDPNGVYIKGKPWLLAPASMWAKLAAVTKTEDGKLVKDVIFQADYKNPQLNNIGMLLGKPFLMNIEVKESKGKDGKTYHNTSLKSPVPLMKGMNPPQAMTAPISVSFNDIDLLEPKEHLNGSCKFDLIRQADLRKIVLSQDYEGTKMQDAVRERMDEAALIEKAKELYAKQIAGNKELQEVLALIDGSEQEVPEPPKKEAAKKVVAPSPDELDESLPF